MLRFDTLEYLETLKASGIPDEQSKAQTQALSKALEFQDVATKSDLLELKGVFKSDILELKVELIKWIIGMAFSFAGIMFVLLRFMLPS